MNATSTRTLGISAPMSTTNGACLTPWSTRPLFGRLQLRDQRPLHQPGEAPRFVELAVERDRAHDVGQVVHCAARSTRSRGPPRLPRSGRSRSSGRRSRYRARTGCGSRSTWIERNRSACSRVATAGRFSSGMNSSVRLVRTTSTPAAARSDSRRSATSRTTSASETPSPRAPGSCPPCPGSMTILEAPRPSWRASDTGPRRRRVAAWRGRRAGSARLPASRGRAGQPASSGARGAARGGSASSRAFGTNGLSG